MPETQIFPLHRRRAGFTLVEISVVLGLIALIMGGVMAGMNLKRSAELKSVPEEITALRNAVSAFKDRYESLPGDMYNATTIWSAANADPATCQATASATSATCNGDGNGMVTTAGTASTYYEAHRFWQHLANGQLLSGKFSGQHPSTGTALTCLTSQSCGNAKYRNGLHAAVTVNRAYSYFTSPTGALELYTGDDKGNAVLLFGNQSVTGTNGAYVGAPLLSSEEADALDRKIDDGKPATGFLQTFKPLASASYLTNSCATTSVATTAEYNLVSSGAQCALLFTRAF